MPALLGHNDRAVIAAREPLSRLRQTPSHPTLLQTLVSPTRERLRQAAFSPDGEFLIAGGESGHLTTWDLASGEFRHIFPRHLGIIRALAISPDNRTLVSAGGDWQRQSGELRIWRLDTPQTFQRLWHHRRPITTAVFSPLGDRLAASGGEGLIRLWRSANWLEEGVLEAHDDEILSLQFSPTGRWLVAGSADRTVTVWDLEHIHPIEVLGPFPSVVESLAFSPDERTLAVGDTFGYLALYQTSDWQIYYRSPIRERTIPSLAFSLDGHTLLASTGRGNDSAIRAWSMRDGHSWRVATRTATIHDVRFDWDGNTFAAATADGEVRLWSWQRKEEGVRPFYLNSPRGEFLH